MPQQKVSRDERLEAPSVGSVHGRRNRESPLHHDRDMTRADADETAALVDAAVDGLNQADAIFVFGTALATPVPLAAELYKKGVSEVIVLTGGQGRSDPTVNEARTHAELLRRNDVPGDALIVEDRSRTTLENVLFAAPLITARIGPLKRVMTIVKWYHRRALLTIAHHIPEIELLNVVTYDPRDPDTGKLVCRDDWWTTGRQRVEKERRYILELIDDGYDPLARTSTGWERTMRPG